MKLLPFLNPFESRGFFPGDHHAEKQNSISGNRKSQ